MTMGTKMNLPKYVTRCDTLLVHMDVDFHLLLLDVFALHYTTKLPDATYCRAAR